jgi:hypothetical protein
MSARELGADTRVPPCYSRNPPSSDVERAGIGNPQEGQKLVYEVQRGQQGKTSAGNLKLA